MGKCGNLKYLSSLAGIFRLLTVIVGVPAMTLAWMAYFKSSWTKTFPEILAIIVVEKSGNPLMTVERTGISIQQSSTPGFPDTSTSSPSTDDDVSTEYDLITDEEEEYLDEILLQTLMYEKFFLGIVSILFVLSALYLIIRVLSKHEPDSPYEIMFDFIFHVAAALGLLTGGALVLLSAAKIQNFIDQVSNGFGDDTVSNIIGDDKEVQDKTDKIAAAVLGMLNGILYALCVVTLRMTEPMACKCCRRQKNLRINQIPIFSLNSAEFQTNSVYDDNSY